MSLSPRIDRLHGLLAFVKTVDLGSFVAASRVLEISASAVGKSVARLEADLGVRLLQRSTRRLQLTEEGRVFHERCRRILDDLDDAHHALAQTRQQPRGRLRVSAPLVAYHLLMPLLPSFLARHPEVELDLVYTDRAVNVIDERIDVALRSGDLPDSSLVSRPLWAFALQIYAAPDYLARQGLPHDLPDLARHQAVRFRHPDTGKLLDWPRRPGTDDSPLRLGRTLACNQMEAVLDATLRGLGLACLPDFLAQDALAQGRLQPVLTACLGAQGQFHAVWASHRQHSPKVRAWVDHLAAHMAADGAMALPAPH